MRPAAVLLVVAALSIVPRVASAQVTVTSPAAGAASSYRNTVISWNPIPGATSYHLEIDDDPNFESPEVDVTVSGTSYALSGQRLKLNSEQSWAAYVRINGTRWNANTFTPSYFGPGGGQTGNAALAVTSQNLVFLAFHDSATRIQLTASSDWSMRRRLSLEDTFNTDPVNLAVDDFDVAHAFWLEQRWGEQNRVPYYTSSATGWDLVRIPITGEGCWKGSSFAARGQFDIFLSCGSEITRWTITNGTQFARTGLPNSANTDSASAARDGVGNVYVASSRDDVPEKYSVLQGSGDGWIPHIAAAGRSPRVAVTREGELHALRWGVEALDATGSMPFLYSNSLRGFHTWTALPIRSQGDFNRDVLPLIVDATRGRLYAALHGDGSIQVCSAAHTGLASNTGTSWTCAPVADQKGGYSPVGALAPDGTVHFAWSGNSGLVGYANSLGSFLAKNFSPQITFGTPSSTALAVIVPAAISDTDGDDLAGDIHVGRIQDVVSLIETGTTEPILQQQYTIRNWGTRLKDDAQVPYRLEFRVIGGNPSWQEAVDRDQISAFPAVIEVRRNRYSETVIGSFTLLAWDSTGATISETDFMAYVMLTYSGALPGEIDISSVPAGNATVAIAASDGSTSGFGSKLFTKTTGQTHLLLTQP